MYQGDHVTSQWNLWNSISQKRSIEQRMRKESFAYLRVQCQSVLCQLELAQGSKAYSSNPWKYWSIITNCVWCFIQNTRKRQKAQIIDHHHRWHSKTHFLSYPAKCLLKAFTRVVCNNCFLLLQSTLQWLRQSHEASEHFLSVYTRIHTPQNESRFVY